MAVQGPEEEQILRWEPKCYATGCFVELPSLMKQVRLGVCQAYIMRTQNMDFEAILIELGDVSKKTDGNFCDLIEIGPYGSLSLRDYREPTCP